MRGKKRWLAAVLSICIAFGDCSGMTVLATGDIVTGESAISENNMILDEPLPGSFDETGVLPDPDTAPETDKAGETEEADEAEEMDETEEGEEAEETDEGAETDKADPQIDLPALHIGQISEGEALPDADDDTFLYDLPISFGTSKKRILFASYAIGEIPETAETGTLVWSILRGGKGLETGSANLLDEADDWNGFEEVSASPFFTLEEITDAGSGYYRMMALVPKEALPIGDDSENHEMEETSENYDYYIRAAYYTETAAQNGGDFYAAVTVPFVPRNDAAAEEGTDETTEDGADTEEDTDGSVPEETSVPENGADETEEELSGEGSVNEDAPVVEEDSATDTAGSLSAENDSMEDPSASPDAETPPSGTEETAVVSILLSGTETLTMQPDGEDSQKQVTATVILEPSDGAAPPIFWESSDHSVATVTAGENGTATITAAAEGYARITASCGGKTASVMVDVVPDTASPDDKFLDLSNEIRVAGFVKESDALVYTGQKITQDLRVYYNENLLTEKTDYTLSYKNNVNAAPWNSAKAPSVTINLKGQYQGSVTMHYTIKPFDINKLDVYGTDSAKTPAYEQAVNYGKNLTIPAPVLTFGRKKLAAKKDFVCDYAVLTEELAGKDYKKGDSYEAGRVYHYTVNGTGNFTGSFQMQLVVLNDKSQNFSAASVKPDKNRYDYSGKPLSKTDVKIETVKISGQTLEERLYDYEVCANGTEGAYLMVFPTEEGRTAGYRGCKKVNLKLAGDRKISEAVFGADWKETIRFSQKTVESAGGMFQEGQELLVFKTDAGTEEPLLEGTDYTIKYGNAKKAGTVTVTFKGMGRYTGSVTKKYKITSNGDSRNLTIVWGKNVIKEGTGLKIRYQKGGASPEFYIRDQDYVVLNSKTDYSVRLKDNKMPGTDEKYMTCTITGKGNYAGYEKTVTLGVIRADIGQSSITIADKPYDTRPGKWKAGATVTDTNGKKLNAKTDYIREIDYSYEGMDPSDPDAVPTSGTIVTAKVTGTGFYDGTLTGTYRIYDKEKDISKLKIVIDPQTYTGGEIKLDKSAVHVYASNEDKTANKELEGKESCFEILESTYKNNVKAGTAKVTLHGIGEYGGTKTYSFKIQKKKYLINRVKGIRLDKTDLTFALDEADVEKRTLAATITAETGEDIANPTVIWTSSDSSIVAIEENPGSTSGSDAGKKTVTTSAILTLKKEGSVTITAVSQDGNKKAQCKVTVVDAPVFLEAGQTIKGNVGSTHQLGMEFTETQDKTKLKWESSNPGAVSVDINGLLTMKKPGVAIIKAVYTSGKISFTQQCYAVAVGENETPPKPETGELLIYEQQDGVTDDTPYINKMLREFEWGDDTHVREVTLYIPAGVYHIDATAGGVDLLGNYKFGGIVLTTNQKLVMSPSALLIALPNNKGNSQVINISGREGVSVSGGQIIGERKTHIGSGGEWGHGIAVFGGRNITISDVEISQCWGDGIYLGYYDNGENGRCSDTVTIKNCNLHHNRRNNLSITDVSNVTVRNCVFNNAGGTAPQYGIDIEPNQNMTCSNITISNSTFRGNAGGTIQILGQLNAHVKGVTIENCSGDKEPVIWQGFGGSVSDVIQRGNQW